MAKPLPNPVVISDDIPIAVTSPLPENATLEIVGGETGAVTGYVFTCASTAEGIAQEQRWVLYSGEALSLPVTLRPSAPPAPSCSSLEEWIAAVESGGLWRAGAWYVMANVRRFSYGDAFDPVKDAPPFPSLRPRGERIATPAPHQMVDLEFVELVQNEGRIAFVYGTDLASIGETLRNREYWVTQIAPAAGVALSLEGGTARRDSVEVFLAQTFVPDATLAIASCAYLHALPDNP